MSTSLGEGILDWFKKTREKVGQRELATLTKQARNNFNQFMGRNGQSLKDVTWDTLFKYLTMPDQLGMSKEGVLKLFKDPEVIQKGKQAAKTAGTEDPATFEKNTWGTKGKIIGSPVDNNTEKRANVIITMFLQLGAIQYLNRQGEEMPDEKSDVEMSPDDIAPAAAPAPRTPTPAASTAPPSPPTPTGNVVNDDRSKAVYDLELALHKLRGI